MPTTSTGLATVHVAYTLSNHFRGYCKRTESIKMANRGHHPCSRAMHLMGLGLLGVLATAAVTSALGQEGIIGILMEHPPARLPSPAACM